MMQAVADRLATIPTIAGRVHGATTLSDVLKQGTMMQVCPAAFVLPLGLRGGAADAASGLFRQSIDRLVGVVLAIRSIGAAAGARLPADLEPLVDAAIEAIAGWGSDDMIGVFTLARGELVSLAGGIITYQLDFAIEDQLRIVC